MIRRDTNRRRSRRRFLPAGLLALVFPGAAPPPLAAQPSPELRVMSFNVRYGTAPDGEDRWELRRDHLFDVVAGFAPHVLGVQEAVRCQLDEMRAARPRFDEVGVGRDDGSTEGEYSALLYDRERLEILDGGTFWFSETPDVPGSRDWGNTLPRICTWARFRDRVTGTELHAFNVHWDHESQPSRERSAGLLLERIAVHAGSGPVIVTGDFNAGPTNPAVRALTGDPRGPLRDTFVELHADTTGVGTFHGFRGGTAGDRIDAVLVGPGWEVVSAGILRADRDGRYPSDHYPVTAVLRPGG
jgi:endonuclease/exonuclease/phosphatase family metal-dependent hydrolase